MRTTILLEALAFGGALALPGTDNDHSELVRRGVKGSYIKATAPFENIFADITKKEQKDIVKFLSKQPKKIIPKGIEFYEGDAWLLAPNKTAATAYLDKKGAKPSKYARIMGWADCFNREYMVGPLPVGDKTKVFPLNYMHNGNATIGHECWSDDSDRTLRLGDELDHVQTLDEFLDKQSQLRPGARLRPGVHGGPRMKKRAALQKRSPDNPYDEEMKWSGKKLPHDDQPPPVAILPSGARHEFDPKQNYVAWMGFTFFVATGPAGISLHDIRFNGDRVIYELGMQEALAHYAGPDLDQTVSSYLDVTIGFNDFNLIPGFDCPTYATYTDAFCLFEYPMDYPMSRHYFYDSWHATKNVAFMVRSISTVGNYDYQTTYEFHIDGSIQVVVRASGYIQGSDLVKGTEPWEYGFHIRKDLSGSMHDHVLNFKADLDILGTKNSIMKTEFVPHSQVYKWSDGKVVNTMKADRSFITNEKQGKINWAPNAAASYAVVNKEKKNEFGEYPGFRVSPTIGSSIHLTVQDSTVFPGQVDWATHPLYALKRKDSEPVSAHPRDSTATKFGKFFNGESLDQQDVVLYFNLGMHHMPDQYDLPVTVFQGAQSGITFRPQNYARSSAAIDTRQQIDISTKNGKVVTNEYGAKKPSGTYDLKNAVPASYPKPADG